MNLFSVSIMLFRFFYDTPFVHLCINQLERSCFRSYCTSWVFHCSFSTQYRVSAVVFSAGFTCQFLQFSFNYSLSHLSCTSSIDHPSSSLPVALAILLGMRIGLCQEPVAGIQRGKFNCALQTMHTGIMGVLGLSTVRVFITMCALLWRTQLLVISSLLLFQPSPALKILLEGWFIPSCD